MSRFSPSETALEGFRVTRAHPLPVLIWALLRLIYSVGSLVLLFGLGGAGFERLVTLENAASKPTAEQVAPIIGQVAPAMFVVLILTLAFYAVVYTAVLRAILRPADKAFAYLRLSIDEARQFGLAALLFLMFFFYCFILEVVALLVSAAAGGLGSQGALLVRILVILGLIAAFAYPVVRLSIAPAMTFADRKISVFRVLPLTRRQFWPILGAYVLALVLMVVVTLLLAVIFMFVIGAIGLAQGGISALPGMLGMMQPKDMTLSGFLAPLRLVNLGFSAVIGTLAYLILFAPSAAIFRELSGRVGAPAATPDAALGKPWG